MSLRAAPFVALARWQAPGFTLLELMVVIVLAGILISIVSINVTPDPQQQLAREGERVGQLLALAADEVRVQQTPIVWEADLRGFRFVTERGGERTLVTGDDLLRARTWQRPLQRLAVVDAGTTQAPQVLLGPGAPAVRRAVVREWIQPRWRLELANDIAQVAVDFDETGHGQVANLPRP